VGVGAEDAVDPTGVEPERVEPPLELGDVVAPQHRLAEVQEAVAEDEAALHERGPCVATDDAVDLEAAVVLERPHRGRGGRTEDAGLVGRMAVAERAETPVEITDCFTPGARTEEQ